LEYLRELGLYNGLSEEATIFLDGKESENNGTVIQYNYRWKKFADWWNQQSFEDSIISSDRVVNFLFVLFEKSYNYNYIASFRSAISSTAPPWKDVPLKQCSLVSKCLERVRKMKPPAPAYENCWDIGSLLQ
jgi:hypothetical protein